MNVVVLIFPPSASTSRRALARSIRGLDIRISNEGGYIICEGRDPTKLASRLANLAGADITTIARKVPSRFSSITNAIVQAGSETILPDEKFYVKVIQQAAKADYVDRDIEFASTGALVGKLAEINALPAKSEQEADRVILAIVGKKSAYICVKDMT